MDIDWSQAPLHATHWCPGNAIIDAGWIYQAGQEFHSCYAEKGLEHIPNFPAWRALRLIPRPAETPKWNGEGLPPVGTVCEYRIGNGTWYPCTIRYVTNPISDEEVQVIIHCPHLNGDQIGGAGSGIGDINFRPIRTPEQIAAEERENAAKSLHKVLFPELSWENLKPNYREGLLRAIDAGYRKQVAP